MNKLIASILIVSFVAGIPFSVFAQDSGFTMQNTANTNTSNSSSFTLQSTNSASNNSISNFTNSATINSQSQQLQNANTSGQAGTSNGTSNNNGAATNAATGAASCASGLVVSGVVRGAISNALGFLGGAATRQVPTNNVYGNAKETGILGSGVGWDSIAYCIGNEVLTYVTQSTINWINSGFNGNPTFVQDPGKFFQDIADREAGGLIQDLGLGFMCSNFRPQIQLAILNDYNSSFAQRSQCTLSGAVQNLQAFQQNFNNGGWNGWIQLTQAPQNNAYGAYLMTQEELHRRILISKENANTELQWGNGFLSFKECEKDANGKDTNNCRTTTPGRIIATQVDQTLGLPKERLALADRFDEVVTALVNQLIKVGLNDALSSGKK